MIRIVFLLMFSMTYFSCKEERKTTGDIIRNEIAYPMTKEQVVGRIGQPDSIIVEDYDTGSFGIIKREIYHYQSRQLIFSPHGVFKGLKSK